MGLVELRIAGRDERVTDEEFEERVRAGRVPGHALVRIPATTGDHFVEAAELPTWRVLREQAERDAESSRVVAPVAVALLVGVQIRLWWWARVPEVRGPLLEFGMNFSPSVFEDGQIWRLLTMGLLQIEVGHAAMNLLWAFFAGWMLERALGRVQLAVLFVTAVAVGSLFSTFASPWVPSLGSSGGVFGLLAALVTFGIVRADLISRRWGAAAGVFVLPYLLQAFWSGLENEGVDNWCHLGGLLTGLTLGLLLDPPHAERRRHWNRYVWGAVGTLLVGAFGAVGVFGPSLEPLVTETEARAEIRHRERPDLEPVPVSAAYRALTWSIPGGWRPERDATNHQAYGSPVGARSFGVRADPRDRPRAADELLDEARAAIVADWPAASFDEPVDATLAGRAGRRVRATTGEGVIEVTAVTRGIWSLTAVWQVDSARERRLAPLRDRLLDAIEWGDPEELVDARAADAKRSTRETKRILASALAAVGEGDAARELHAALLTSPDTDAWRGVLADELTLGADPDAVAAVVERMLTTDPDGKGLTAAADALDLAGNDLLAQGLLEVAWARTPGERSLRRARSARNLSVTLVDGAPWGARFDPATRAPRAPDPTPELTVATARTAGERLAADRARVAAAAVGHLRAHDPAALVDLMVLHRGDDRASDEDRALILGEVVAEPAPAWLPAEVAAECLVSADWLRSLGPVVR